MGKLTCTVLRGGDGGNAIPLTRPFRRGLRYGSILVDLETHRVIDLLPERTATTATAWFKAHPDIEIISRDRSADYALAATLGAPQALQVADRWHLVRNLADTLDAFLRRQAPFQKSARKSAESKGQKNKPATPDLRLTPAQQERREQVRESFTRVQSLYEQGHSLREIANVVHLDTNTLRYGCRRANHGPEFKLIGDATQEMRA